MSRYKPYKKHHRRYQQESDAGDVAKKFMQGLGYIHKVGGRWFSPYSNWCSTFILPAITQICN